MLEKLKYKSPVEIPRELSTTPARESSDSIPDHKFYWDMFDLLTKKSAGKYFHYVVEGDSFSLWEEFTKAAEHDGTYYQFNNEAELIQDNPEWFRKMIGMANGDESYVIELGTGSDNGVKHKTIPFVTNVNGKVYLATDESLPSAMGAVMGVKQARPDTAAFWRSNVDFNVDDLKVEWNDLKNNLQDGAVIGGKVIKLNKLPKMLPAFRTMAMFGGTLGNAEGFIGDPLPEEFVSKSMRNYRRHLRPGDVLFMGVDQNQNRISLAAAYGDERIAQFSMALLKRIKTQLPVSAEFDPDNFEYANQWFPRNSLFVHGFKAKTNGTFTIRNPQSGEDVQITHKKGEFFTVYCNSYKFPPSFMKSIAEQSGFRIRDSLADSRRWIHIHALEAV